MRRLTIDELQEDVVNWADSISEDRQPKDAVVKMVSETAELLDAVLNNGDVEAELGDCFILLLDLAKMHNVDLIGAGERKMNVNHKRHWRNEQGVIRRQIDGAEIVVILEQLLLQEVKRFSICHVNREQSVAEHSFNVLLIAMWLVEEEEPLFQHTVMRYAVEHDMEEIETGDIPSPFKRRLRTTCPEVIKVMDGDHNYPDEVKSIVKMADCLEAIYYLAQFGGSKYSMERILPDIRTNFHFIANTSRVDERIRLRAIAMEKTI